MTDKQTILQQAVANQDVPFIVAMVGNSNDVTWQGQAGDGAPGIAAGENTVMRIFSATKSIGSTAAMILVDRGQLDIDTPVETILPEFRDVQLLDGFDEAGQPKLRAPEVKATVRHLATHTSGFAYEFFNADALNFMTATEHPSILAGSKASMYYPLVCEPGSGWQYGIGIDWLGQVVEAIDGRRIDRFCGEEIFAPLGMADTVFELDDGRNARLADLNMRGPDGVFGAFELAPPPNPEVYGMGHCLYSTAADYMKYLQMHLDKVATGDGRILSEAAAERMQTNHIGELRVNKLATTAPELSADFEPFPDIPKTHSFGFMRNEDDVPGMRSAGSQSWAGVCNTHYWFDPKKDVRAVLFTQSLPFVEDRFMKLYEDFERAVYAEL